MNQNLYKLWLALLIVSGGIALWFTSSALNRIVKFSLLNDKTIAQVLSWQVRELASSRFAIEAEYKYTVKETTYRGKTKFDKPQFLNRYAAESYIGTLGSQSWKTWYRESDPARSSLERKFPKKKCLQAVLTLGVFAYFYFARRMGSKAFN